MSEDQTTEPVEQPQTESLNFKMLREQNEALKAQVDKLSGVARIAAFEKAGIDPSNGLGKAIYNLYDGDVDPNAITTFASEEFGWEPPKPAAVSPSQQRVDTLMGLGEAPGPNDTASKIAEAEAAQDWQTAMALKDQQLRAVAQSRFGY